MSKRLIFFVTVLFFVSGALFGMNTKRQPNEETPLNEFFGELDGCRKKEPSEEIIEIRECPDDDSIFALPVREEVTEKKNIVFFNPEEFERFVKDCAVNLVQKTYVKDSTKKENATHDPKHLCVKEVFVSPVTSNQEIVVYEDEERRPGRSVFKSVLASSLTVVFLMGMGFVFSLRS
ncbi:hypothetical protein KKA53_00355 [Candidatus Dependentiae bacterium]|nr:hypothetical protein [Candidatus Dependentiae bacterium]